MGFCFMTIDKIHTMGEMKAKYNHNYRKINVDNADPQLKFLNQELVKLPVRAGDGMQYEYADAFRERLSKLPYYRDHNIRKGQVLAYEVVLTFSREDNIDLDTWKKKNVLWLQDTFNKAPDGRNNVLSVVYHADEPGNVHCHALVMPVDERGHLCASSFTDGSRAMSDLQTSYGKYMEEFGLERGLEGGQASHKDIRKYYAELNQAKKLPEPEINEAAQAYRQRVFEQIETMQLAAKRDRDLEEAKHKRRMAEERVGQRKMMQIESDAVKATTALEVSNMKSEIKELADHKVTLLQEISILEQKKDILNEEINDSFHAQDSLEVLQRKADFYDQFNTGIQNLSYHNPECLKELQEIMQEMQDVSREQEL